ncbi:unnamed protein product [Mesocestoides corti]|nr:unnamed protein product [Mesocestoides corti]
MEQHLPANELLRRPYLYRLMSQSSNLRCWYILLWVMDGWWHGSVVYFVCYYVLCGGMLYSDATFFQSGVSYSAVDFELFGNAIFIYLVVTCTMRSVIASRHLNLALIIGLFLTGILNLAVMFLYQYTSGPIGRFYMAYIYLGSCPAFWLCLPLVTVLALLPDILWRISSDAWWDYQIALSGVKRMREKRSRKAWRQFVGRGNSSD